MPEVNFAALLPGSPFCFRSSLVCQNPSNVATFSDILDRFLSTIPSILTFSCSISSASLSHSPTTAESNDCYCPAPCAGPTRPFIPGDSASRRTQEGRTVRQSDSQRHCPWIQHSPILLLPRAHHCLSRPHLYLMIERRPSPRHRLTIPWQHGACCDDR